MRTAAALILVLIGIACIVGAIESFQVTESYSSLILDMENEKGYFDVELYRSLVHQQAFYGRVFMAFIAGIILSFGSSGALLVKEP